MFRLAARRVAGCVHHTEDYAPQGYMPPRGIRVWGGVLASIGPAVPSARSMTDLGGSHGASHGTRQIS